MTIEEILEEFAVSVEGICSYEFIEYRDAVTQALALIKQEVMKCVPKEITREMTYDKIHNIWVMTDGELNTWNNAIAEFKRLLEKLFEEAG